MKSRIFDEEMNSFLFWVTKNFLLWETLHFDFNQFEFF